LVNPFGIIEVSTPGIWNFWLFFSSLHDFWHPSTWNALVHTSGDEMEQCE